MTTEREWTYDARSRIVRVMRRTLDPHALALLAANVRDVGPVAVAHTAHVSLATLYRALRGLRVCDVTHHSLTATARTAPVALAEPDDSAEWPQRKEVTHG